MTTATDEAIDRFPSLQAWHCGRCGTLANVADNVVTAACACGSLCSPAFHVPVVSVEPVPATWDFERPNVDGDLSFWQVKDALDRLGWHPGLDPMPLLVVHPRGWYAAEGVVARVLEQFGGRIAVHYEVFSNDDDNWLVAWRGRRAGSVGA